MGNSYYKDRLGNLIERKGSDGRMIRALYETLPGRMLLKVLTTEGFANVERAFLDTKASTFLIDPFIKINNISLKDCIPYKYSSFNDFFTRLIWPDSRKFIFEKDEVASPADGFITVSKINSDSVFKIKNSRYSVHSLLRDKKLAKYYEGGYFVLVRLCVDNYHHYSYCVNGVKSYDRYINGFLHTVNPVALDYVNVYSENSRSYSVIKADNGSLVTQMEVGALGVGRICNNEIGFEVAKIGEEKGEFQFGGSSIILMFPKDKFVPDSDLVANSREDLETKIFMCDHIGVLK